MTVIDQEVGVGQCPDRPEGFGHVWAGANASGDASNPCRFCGTSGREFFHRACAARMNGFVGVVLPMESGTGKREKAWPNGMPAEMAARAARIVEEKRARDAEARKPGKS